MQRELDDLRERISLLTVRQGLCQLQLAEQGRDTTVWVTENGGLCIALLLIVFEGPNDGTIRDVKEQEVYLGEFARYPAERWSAYIEGSLRALQVIVESLGGDLDVMLPVDVFTHARVLDDPTLVSADDFAAVLGDPARLAAINLEIFEEDWRDTLTACGLAAHGTAVRALLRPSLRLSLDRDWSEEDDDADEGRVVGESRVGGCPDLPPDLPWPEAHGRPLMFVAQFDLAKISRYPAARELPGHGLLSFFYDPHGEDDMSHAVRVLHLAETAALAPRKPPPGGERLAYHGVRVKRERELPGIASEYFFHALLPAEQVQPWYERLAAGDGADPPIDADALRRLIQTMGDRDGERPMHQLLGHPDSIQGDPYLDVEVTTNPGGWDGWRDGTPESFRLRDRALRWRLLLQIDATQDDELLLNQDGGYFYFWIPDDALAAHDWSRARGSLQCH